MENTVLVVDPDHSNLSFLREKLEASNLKVRTADSGEEALILLGRDAFSLVVCALEMPHPNGLELLVRAREHGMRGPFLFLTRLGNGGAKVRDRAASYAPVDFLDRPVFLNRLYERIEFLLQMKIEWRERRISDRYPVHVDLTLTIRGKTDTVFTVRSKTIDVSLGGLQFERKTCDICTGYQKGGVHPDCILARFALRPGGQAFPIALLPADEKPLPLRARVAWTLIQEGTTREFVGLKFEDMNHDERERLRAFIRRMRETRVIRA